MNILHIGPSVTGSRGGMATVIGQIQAAEKLGKTHSVRIWPSFIDGSVPVRLLYSIGSFLKFLPISGQYDLYHVHMSERGSIRRKNWYISVGRMLGKKIVLHMHGSEFAKLYNAYPPRRQRRIRKILSKADRMVVLSEEWRSFYCTIFPPEKIAVIHNAVELPAQQERDYSGPNVLFLGRVGDRKGTFDLLQAFAELADAFPDTQLYIGGDGELDRARGFLKEHRLEGRVHLEGWIGKQEQESLYEKCDVFTLPSYNEGLPMAVLEAMAHGAAVVTSDVGGLPQLVQNGENGCIVKPGDIPALRDALASLLASADQRRRIGSAARRTIEANFGFHTFEEQLLQLYAELGGTR